MFTRRDIKANNLSLKSDRPIQSLWIGSELSIIEQLCINSFIENGHHFHLYTYGKVKKVPKGTQIFDANEILPLSQKFEIKSGFGVGSKAPFSDFFRFSLLLRKGGWWVDMDTICLKNFNTLPEEVIATSYEIPDGDFANINVLSFPSNHYFIKECLKAYEAIDMNDYYYAFGVNLVKDLIRENNYYKFLVPHSYFNPTSYRLNKHLFTTYTFLIGFVNLYKRFRSQELIELPGRDSFSVHLWNETLKSAGLSKNETYSRYTYIEKLKKKYRPNNRCVNSGENNCSAILNNPS